jgi:hypothetical protein
MRKGGAPEQQQVLTGILPLFGTWVGTILTFYFTRQNFEAATDSLQNALQAQVDKELKSTPVTAVMTPRSQIKGTTIPSGKSEKDLNLLEICTILTEPKITRVPVFNQSGVVMYVLHESTVYKYLAEEVYSKSKKPSDVTLDEFF